MLPTEPPSNGQTAHKLALFRDGDVIADRYQVIRYINHGAMGVVYEVNDLQLNERVALKAIRVDTAQDPKHVERFKREIQLARKVTHPHVCRLFDVGFHELAPDPKHGWFGGQVTFFTMELLQGEPLDHYIESQGRLTEAESREIIAQIADALAAAHDAGVLHGDLKSPNVILLREGESGHRAVVTDFGLAKSIQAEGHFFTTVGGMDHFVGTPAFMAPEQVEGGELDRSTDIYALGCIYYQLLTGEVPFMGETMVQTALMRMVHDPEPPRRKNPNISRHTNRLIMRCLERKQSERFRNSEQFIEALEGKSPIKKRRFGWLAAIAAVGLIGWLGYVLDQTRKLQPNPQEMSRLTMALLPARVESPDEAAPAWLGQWVDGHLESGVSLIDNMGSVAPENVQRTMAEVGEFSDREPTIKLHLIVARQVQANWTWATRVTCNSKSPRYHLRVRGMDLSRERFAFAYEQSGNSLAALIQGALTAFAKARNREIKPFPATMRIEPDQSTSRIRFEEGRKLLVSMQLESALRALSDAAGEEPDNPQFGLWLALAYAVNGQRDTATQAIRALADRVEPDQRVEFARVINDYKALVRSYQAILEPQSTTNPASDALEELASLMNPIQVQKPIPAPNVPMNTTTARLLLAEAFEGEAEAYRAMQDSESAMDLFQQGLQAYQDVGDLEGVARSHHNMGVLLLESGQFKASKVQLRKAIQIWRDLGQPAWRSEISLAQAAYATRDLNESSTLALRILDWQPPVEPALRGLAYRIQADIAATNADHVEQARFLALAVEAFDSSQDSAIGCELRLQLARLLRVQAPHQLAAVLERLDACTGLNDQQQAVWAILSAHHHDATGAVRRALGLIQPWQQNRGYWLADERALAARLWGEQGLAVGDVALARRELEESCHYYLEAGDTIAGRKVLVTLAQLYFDMGLYALAQKTYVRLLAFDRDDATTQLTEKLGDALYQEGGLLRSTGQWDKAIDKYRDARARYQSAQAWRKMAVTGDLLADCLVHAEDFEAAIEVLRDTIERWAAINDGSHSANARSKLADQLEITQQSEEALSHFVLVAEYWTSTENHSTALDAWRDVARLADKVGQQALLKEASRRIRMLERIL